MTISIVLADANILFSRVLRDYFLYLAGEGAIEIRWSQQILDEMSRNLRGRRGFDHAATARLEALMNAYLEYALIEVGPSELALAQGVAMDSGDRHVLAAALAAEADVLLTQNTRHFPQDWMAERGIELLTAQDLLIRLAAASPVDLRAAHAQVLRFSAKTETEVLATLERSVGRAATGAVRSVLEFGRGGSPCV